MPELRRVMLSHDITFIDEAITKISLIDGIVDRDDNYVNGATTDSVHDDRTPTTGAARSDDYGDHNDYSDDAPQSNQVIEADDTVRQVNASNQAAQNTQENANTKPNVSSPHSPVATATSPRRSTRPRSTLIRYRDSSTFAMIANAVENSKHEGDVPLSFSEAIYSKDRGK